MKIIAYLLSQSRGLGLTAILAGVVSGGCSAGVVALLSASARGESTLPLDLRIRLFIVLVLLVPVTMILTQYLTARLTFGAVLDIRLRLGRRILQTPLRRLEELGSHRLLTALTEDVLTVSSAIMFLPMIWINCSFLIGLLIYLAWLSWFEMVILLVTTVMSMVTYRLIASRAMTFMRQVRLQGEKLFNHYRSLTQGTKELKLNRRRLEDFFITYEATAEVIRAKNVVARTLFMAAGSWVNFLILAVLGAILFMPDRDASDAAVLTTFVIIMLFVLTLLQKLLDSFAGLGRADVSLERLEQLGFSLEEPAPLELADVREPASFERLEVVGLTHRYRHESSEHEEFTLGPLDLTFKPSEVVILSGGNGSGKTTLAKLILGLYTPEKGEIRLDGQPVTEENVESYRQLFSTVFSDFYLFEKFFGVRDPKVDEKARMFLEKLQLDHKVEITEGGVSTTELSQGQRKRLALLTSYLEDRPIFVFDEWAADQDPYFKEIFYRELLPEMKARGKCVIAISHDDHYYSTADRVIRLNYGQIEYEVQGEELRAREARTLV